MSSQSASSFWLGAMRATSTSGWSWIESSPFIFTNWATGGYDSTQRCIVLSKLLDSKWTTTECYTEHEQIKYNYICKKLNSESTTQTTIEPTTQSGVNYGCESGWSPFESSCYLYSNSIGDHKTFDEAKAACRQEKADLAEVMSKRENQFLVSLLRSRAANSRRLGCPTGWSLVYDNCYKFISEPKSDWRQANDYCSKLGGYIATIKSIEQQAFLTSLIQNCEAVILALS